MTIGELIPVEADLDRAPDLLTGATTARLAPEYCNLEYWLHAVAQGTLRGLIDGHRAGTETPEWMKVDGPLRTALLEELAFRSIAEEMATRALGHLVRLAPDVEKMEFFTTQLMDEARHARVFRGHLIDLGVPSDDVDATLEEVAGRDRDRVLRPLEAFGLRLAEQEDFIGGVALLTILVEGVLAPSAELSERKWRLLDPAAAEIERAAGIDEIRHLSVGSEIIRQHLQDRPDELSRLRELIECGQKIWMELPVLDVVLRREELFQVGMQELSDHLVGCEIWPGRLMLDTDAPERLQAALTWSANMQQDRLNYMGL